MVVRGKQRKREENSSGLKVRGSPKYLKLYSCYSMKTQGMRNRGSSQGKPLEKYTQHQLLTETKEKAKKRSEIILASELKRRQQDHRYFRVNSSLGKFQKDMKT